MKIKVTNIQLMNENDKSNRKKNKNKKRYKRYDLASK